MITIRNKKTGEVKQIEETQLGDFGLTPSVKSNLMMPTTETPAQVQTTQPKTPKITFDQIYKMSLDPNVKTSTYNKFKALYDLQKEEEKANKLTSEEIKIQEEKKSAEKSKLEAMNVVDELLSRDTGAITGLKNPLKSLTGENQLTKSLYEQLKSLLSLESRQKLKGSGAISDYEFKVLEKSATALSTKLNNRDFENELLKIKGILAGKPVEKLPKAGAKEFFEGKTIPAVGATIGGLAGSILGPAGSIAGAGIGYAGGDVVRKGIQDITGMRKIEGVDNVKDVVDTAVGAVGASALQAVGIGAGKLLSKGINLAKPLFTKTPPKITNEALMKGIDLVDEGKAMRTQAIEKASELSKKVNTKNILNIIKNELSDLKKVSTPSEKKQIDILIKESTKNFGKEIDPKEAKRLWDLATQGFKDSGKVGDTVKARYHMAIRDGIRKELDKIAPGFEKGTAQIAEGLKIDKFLKGIRNAQDRKIIKEAMIEEPAKVVSLLKSFGKTAGGVATGMTVSKLIDIFLRGNDQNN